MDNLNHIEIPAIFKTTGSLLRSALTYQRTKTKPKAQGELGVCINISGLQLA